MKPVPEGARTRNLSGKDYCRYCDNESFVVVYLRPASAIASPEARPQGHVEEVGPCPFCELGVKVEFQKGSPWGADGFWQGHEHVNLEPHSSRFGWKAATGTEGRQLLEKFGRAIGARLAPPDGADGAADPSLSQTPPAQPAPATSTSSAPGDGFGRLVDA